MDKDKALRILTDIHEEWSSHVRDAVISKPQGRISREAELTQAEVEIDEAEEALVFITDLLRMV